MQTWHEAIGAEKQQPYFQHIIHSVHHEREAGQIVYPPAADVFNAFRATEFGRVRVVILGQDPYHGANQAHGLAFSVREGVAVPPSLVNIYKELAQDIPGFQIPKHGYLQSWAEQGVLLLNTVLTVRAGSTKGANTWYSCCGAAMRRKKAPLSTAPAIWYSPRRTPRRSPPTAASSAAAISRKPTPICNSTACHRLIGKSELLTP